MSERVQEQARKLCQNHTSRNSKGELLPEFHYLPPRAGRGRHKYCDDYCYDMVYRQKNRNNQRTNYSHNRKRRLERYIVQKHLESIGVTRRDLPAALLAGWLNVSGATRTTQHEHALKTLAEIHKKVASGCDESANLDARVLQASLAEDNSVFSQRVKICCDGVRCDTGEPWRSPSVVKAWYARTTRGHDRLNFVHALEREANRLRMTGDLPEALRHIQAAKSFLQYRCRTEDTKSAEAGPHVHLGGGRL